MKARRAGVSPSLEAVDYRKRRRIVRAALEYISTRRLIDVAVRFDVVAVTLNQRGAPAMIHVVKDAFSAANDVLLPGRRFFANVQYWCTRHRPLPLGGRCLFVREESAARYMESKVT